jgi:hypothetical protein
MHAKCNRDIQNSERLPTGGTQCLSFHTGRAYALNGPGLHRAGLCDHLNAP